MGVHDLWPILSDICERKPLKYLSGKKVAVDLSGWVVQAMQCKRLQTVRNPHLRNLFFRVSCLLQLGVYPIFVTEGKPPTLKEAVIKERNNVYSSNSTNSTTRKAFDHTLNECQQLLKCLGVPCIKSSGEAEAFCAFLFLNGIVDGVITEDNDAFLYGADVVYRDFAIDQHDAHINVYCLKSKKNKLQLDREKLVALALLLGCDYSKGVHTIGREAAVKFLTELNSKNVLERFQEWKTLTETELFPGLNTNIGKKNSHCTRCGHLGSHAKHRKDGCSVCESEITCYLSKDKPCTCAWHLSENAKEKFKHEIKVYNAAKKCQDFPNQKVIDEYLNFTDNIPSSETLYWNCPNLIAFQEKTLNCLGWTSESSFQKMLPLITSWQQFMIKTYGNKSDFIYEPIEILKERTKNEVDYYEVQWKLIDGDNYEYTSPTGKLITLEEESCFSSCYKELVKEFHTKQKELKEQKKVQAKLNKASDPASNRKVNTEVQFESLNVIDAQHLILPEKLLSSNDSFNGLLDIPLSERIKYKLFIENVTNNSSIETTENNCDKMVSVLCSEWFDSSDVFSPCSVRVSDTEMFSKYDELLKEGESLMSIRKSDAILRV